MTENPGLKWKQGVVRKSGGLGQTDKGPKDQKKGTRPKDSGRRPAKEETGTERDHGFSWWVPGLQLFLLVAPVFIAAGFLRISSGSAPVSFLPDPSHH